MYTLHYAPDNASLILRLVLDGAGIPYRTALVDRTKRQQDSAAYRALNPTGLVPTLETPLCPISETGAILLWLVDTHQLGPGPADPERPVQFIFAGKAHPRDDSGKELIRQIIAFSRQPAVRNRFVFLEDVGASTIVPVTEAQVGSFLDPA